MRTLWMLVLALLLIGQAAPALGFESITDQELAEVRGNAGLTLEVLSGDVFGEPGLSPDEAARRWEGLDEDQRNALRQDFRRRLMDLPPEERARIRTEMLQSYEAMPPEQKDLLRREMQERIKSMTPEEATQFQTFRQEMLAPPGPGTGPGMKRP